MNGARRSKKHLFARTRHRDAALRQFSFYLNLVADYQSHTALSQLFITKSLLSITVNTFLK